MDIRKLPIIMRTKLKYSTLLLVIFLSCLFGMSAFGEQRQVIRVAYPIQAGLSECDGEGGYSGYTYEYLLEIAQYTGWEYEFVQIPGDINESLSAMLEMLEDGELDLMGGIMYSEGMAGLYDYAGHSYGTVYTVLSVPYEDASTAVIDSKRGYNLRVAVLPTMTTRMQELKDYCRLNGIEVDLVYCTDETDQAASLRDGRADAILDVSLNLQPGMRQIARFAPRPFYFITTKGNQQIIQEINRAIVNIEQMDPYFSTMLYEKYFMADSGDIILSEEEQAYLKGNPVIRVGYRVDAPPFQYRDETGQAAGIAIDVLQEIAGRIGMEFEYVPAGSREALSEMMKARSVDMIAAFVYDYETSREARIAMTRPYVTSQFVLAVHETQLSGLVSKKGRLAVSPEYSRIFPDAQVMNGTGNCLQAVLDGKVQGAYGDSYTIQYYLNHPGFSGLRLFSQGGREFRMSFGVLMPGRTELLSILNKTVISLKEEQVQDILYRNILYQRKVSLLDTVKQNPIEAIVAISVVLLCVILSMAWVLRSRIRLNRKMEVNLRRYQEVFGLSSEHLLEYNYKTKELTVARPDGKAQKAGGNEVYWLSEKYCSEKLMEDNGHAQFLNVFCSMEEGSRDLYAECPDGKYRWLRVAMRLIRDEDGKPAYKLGKVSDIDQEIREKEELLAQAAKDGLTRLLNTGSARNAITKALQEKKPGQKAAMILMDIDYFKQVNDTCGHPEGDRILGDVADALRRHMGKDGIAGRIGGDEFVLFFPSVTGRGAVEEICQSLCREIHFSRPDLPQPVTVSIGGVVVPEQVGYDELYQRADEILYRAKKNGRDRYEIGE